MKRNHYICCLLALLSSLTVLAYDAEIDGIYYNFSEDKAKVTFQKYQNNSYVSDYSGDVVIPESVTYKDKNYRVTSIDRCAFSSCFGLTSVTIGNSVTSIGDYAFNNCGDLTTITIPNSVTSIGISAFHGCYFLPSSFINNSSLTSNNNWGATFYDKETTDGLLISGDVVIKCKPWATSVTIPEGITSLGNTSFRDCYNLKSVTITEGVTSIESQTFNVCI